MRSLSLAFDYREQLALIDGHYKFTPKPYVRLRFTNRTYTGYLGLWLNEQTFVSFLSDG